MFSFVSHLQSLCPVLVTCVLQAYKPDFAFSFAISLFQILPVLQGFLFIHRDKTFRLFSCAHWQIPFFGLDAKWSISVVQFLIFVSLVPVLFLRVTFFPFLLLKTLCGFLVSQWEVERRPYWKADFYLRPSSQSESTLSICTKFYRLCEAPLKSNLPALHMLPPKFSYFQLISLFRCWFLIVKKQKLGKRCMVIDDCQDGRNCSTVPYAFLLLSEIGCLKL